MTDFLEFRHYRIHPLLEGIAVGLAILTVALGTTFFIFFHALNAEEQEIAEAMQRQAQMVATLVDGDVHKTFYEKDLLGEAGLPDSAQYTNAWVNSKSYRDSVRPLGRAVLETCDKRLLEGRSNEVFDASVWEKVFDKDNGCSLIFAYTVILKKDRVYYVLDPWPKDMYDPNQPEVEMKSDIMEVYPEAPAEMLAALKEQKAGTTEVYSDPWGDWISAYAPFYDSQGKFEGIVGIDMKADRYTGRLKPIKTAATRAFLAIGIIAYLMGSSVWFLRNFLLVVNDKRIRLKSAYDDLQAGKGEQRD